MHIAYILFHKTQSKQSELHERFVVHSAQEIAKQRQTFTLVKGIKYRKKEAGATYIVFQAHQRYIF